MAEACVLRPARGCWGEGFQKLGHVNSIISDCNGEESEDKKQTHGRDSDNWQVTTTLVLVMKQRKEIKTCLHWCTLVGFQQLLPTRERLEFHMLYIHSVYYFRLVFIHFLLLFFFLFFYHITHNIFEKLQRNCIETYFDKKVKSYTLSLIWCTQFPPLKTWAGVLSKNEIFPPQNVFHGVYTITHFRTEQKEWDANYERC